MNLKQILRPKCCNWCKFVDYTEFGDGKCGYGIWKTEFIEDEKDFDPDKMIHKDCPLLRIKCENCKWHAHLEGDIISAIYCNKIERITYTACIEFEEVK